MTVVWAIFTLLNGVGIVFGAIDGCFSAVVICLIGFVAGVRLTRKSI